MQKLNGGLQLPQANITADSLPSDFKARFANSSMTKPTFFKLFPGFNLSLIHI